MKQKRLTKDDFKLKKSFGLHDFTRICHRFRIFRISDHPEIQITLDIFKVTVEVYGIIYI